MLDWPSDAYVCMYRMVRAIRSYVNVLARLYEYVQQHHNSITETVILTFNII